MRYGFEAKSDGTKTVYVFADEFNRMHWIAASPSARGVLSGNSREVKSALYRGVGILADHPKEDVFTHIGEAKPNLRQDRENV